ncbi:hypothetical protein C8E87_3224 [Paractinoplanes brasiliensis]|uniref:Uncharacterized protein n=2 Tax=Paractinoplanes brasiliensis TaxID=52695 RepID=A0A4R6JS85_9ACTN|nr:hypothetical protein C8E87_3224 [Actinoplanes brasiliensis]
MAGRSGIAEEVKESLRRMKDGSAGPEMAEVARDLLEGRIRLRDLSMTDVYSGPLMDAIDRYKRWESELTPEQRDALAEQVRERFGVDVNELRRS